MRAQPASIQLYFIRLSTVKLAMTLRWKLHRWLRMMRRGGCIAVITRMDWGGPATAVQLDLEATKGFVLFKKVQWGCWGCLLWVDGFRGIAAYPLKYHLECLINFKKVHGICRFLCNRSHDYHCHFVASWIIKRADRKNSCSFYTTQTEIQWIIKFSKTYIVNANCLT